MLLLIKKVENSHFLGEIYQRDQVCAKQRKIKIWDVRGAPAHSLSPSRSRCVWPTREDMMWLVLGHKEKTALEASAAKLV